MVGPVIRLLFAATLLFGGGYVVVVGIGENSAGLAFGGLAAFVAGGLIVWRESSR